jgi:hypothetical protein
MAAAGNDLPDDIDALKTALLAVNDRAEQVTAELAMAKAKASDDQALIAPQRLQIAKLTRELYGQHSERSVRLPDQMELAFEELESSATEGRTRRRTRRGEDDQCGDVHPQAAGAAAFPRALAARAGGRARTFELPVLRQRTTAQAGRGCYRDAGGDPATVEGDPACPREVHLPRLREDQPGAGAS